jgi:hypothetical protein
MKTVRVSHVTLILNVNKRFIYLLLITGRIEVWRSRVLLEKICYELFIILCNRKEISKVILNVLSQGVE